MKPLVSALNAWTWYVSVLFDPFHSSKYFNSIVISIFAIVILSVIGALFKVCLPVFLRTASASGLFGSTSHAGPPGFLPEIHELDIDRLLALHTISRGHIPFTWFKICHKGRWFTRASNFKNLSRVTESKR